MKLTLFCILALVSLTQARHIYGREFQLGLQESLFENGREAGFEAYWEAWGEAAGIDYRTLNAFYSAREQYSYQDIEQCGSNDFIRIRDYVFGDLEGLTTVDIKSSGPLEIEEAEAEPFQPDPDYESSALEQIEFDVHPCRADYASNTRISLNERQNINTCADIDSFFPNAVTNNNELVERGNIDIIYTAERNGTFLQGYVTLDITINYPTLQDAIQDTNRDISEFSFTIISANGNIFTDEQTSKGIEIYEYLLTEIGSDGADWPCDDGTTIDDFFEEDFRVSPEESSNSSATSTSNSPNSPNSSNSPNSPNSPNTSNTSNSPNSPDSESSAPLLLGPVMMFLCILIV